MRRRTKGDWRNIEIKNPAKPFEVYPIYWTLQFDLTGFRFTKHGIEP